MIQNETSAISVPTESVEQQCLFRWAAFQSGRYPELKRLKGNKTSDEQKAWLSGLEAQGYFYRLVQRLGSRGKGN